MLKRRVPRVLASGFLLAVAVSGLTACRTSPDVAAYVGDEQVTVAELEAAVADRTADPDIAAYAGSNEVAYTRQILSLLVEQEVYAATAQRYGVRVSDGDVRARIDELLGDDDPDAVFAELARTQGVSRDDITENVRQQLLRQRAAEAEGAVEASTEPALRARYEEIRESLAEYSFGYLTVPDQATADAVLAQLTAAPDSYAALAAQYAGPLTLPALESRATDGLPSVLAEGITAAGPNTGFTVAVPEAEGVVVGFVAGTVYPPFEEVRPRLRQEAADAAGQAGIELVNEVREDLGVQLNPRFDPAEGGVVDILGDEDTASPPTE